MPTAPPSRCTDPTCHAIAIAHGRCAAHQRPAWQHGSAGDRSLSSKITGTRRWQKIRETQLRQHPFCQDGDCDALAVEVDHVIPVSRGGPPWDRSNHQSLCGEHHDEKSIRERAEADANRPRHNRTYR